MNDIYAKPSRLQFCQYNRMFLLLCAISIILICNPLATHAQQDQQAPVEALPITTTDYIVDYTTTESLGLLDMQDEESYGSGVYHHTNRSQLTPLLKGLKQSNWIVMRPAIKNFLLTQTDISALIQDTPIIPGEDLLTLRLNALLDLGYIQESFELYQKASDNILDEPTIRAGVYAMLLNRQKGLACLEVKTVIPRFKNIPFWTQLDAYCEASLPHTNDGVKTAAIKDIDGLPIIKSLLESPDYSFQYEPESFTALSTIERAILTAEGRLTLGYITAETIITIPPQHIAPLLTQPTEHLSLMQKALLLGAATNYDIKQPEAMTGFYKKLLAQQKEAKDQDQQQQFSKETHDLYILANLYDETSGKWSGTGRTEKISQAIVLAHKYSDKLLIPFLTAISKMTIGEDISLETALSLAPLYLYIPEHISKTWIKDLLKMHTPKTLRKYEMREKLIISLFLLSKNSKRSIQDKIYTYIYSASLHSPLAKDIINIIENSSNTVNDGDKVHINGVNGFDLATNKRYTMPPYYVSNALKQASENQNISVSLLLSAHILSEIDKKDVYIGTIADIASALSNVSIRTLPDHIIAQTVMETGGSL